MTASRSAEMEDDGWIRTIATEIADHMIHGMREGGLKNPDQPFSFSFTCEGANGVESFDIRSFEDFEDAVPKLHAFFLESHLTGLREIYKLGYRIIRAQ